MSCGRKLTEQEQVNALGALQFLRARIGTWKLLAASLGFDPVMLRKVKKRDRAVSINMAYCISRLAGVPFDDVVTGRYPAPGTCPHCGRGP
jgi:hypothetical protein